MLILRSNRSLNARRMLGSLYVADIPAPNLQIRKLNSWCYASIEWHMQLYISSQLQADFRSVFSPSGLCVYQLQDCINCILCARYYSSQICWRHTMPIMVCDFIKNFKAEELSYVYALTRQVRWKAAGEIQDNSIQDQCSETFKSCLTYRLWLQYKIGAGVHVKVVTSVRTMHHLIS